MSMPANLLSQISIKVDGSAVADTVMEAVIDVVVEDDLAQPSMFTLRFHDPQLTLVDGSLFALGAEVSIGAIGENSQVKPILTGEVASLEIECGVHERSLIVRGYDLSHRLYRGRKTRTFLKTTDSAIVSKVAQEAGLSADVQSTSIQHDYVMQDSQTDMEFLRDRAARVGYRVVVEGRKLKFRTMESSPPEAPEQKWGVTLLSFNGRLSATSQPNQVEVRGWNTKTKQAIVGTASTPANPNAIGDGKTGGAAAQTAFGSAATLTICDIPVGTPSEATALAQSVLDHMAGDYLTAEGLCLGEPAIKAGSLVKITNMGAKFSGKYFVTSARHEYTPADGYTTTFVVNGRRPNSLGALNGAPGGGNGAQRHLSHGVALAVITNINDPDGLGRVKLKFPWLDDAQESDWAWVVASGAGPSRGLEVPMEVNDQVLVAFEQGDISRPFVLGGVWNSSDAPPGQGVADGKVKAWAITTRAGHSLAFLADEGAKKGAIIVKTVGGRTITISDNDKHIEVKSEKHTIKLDDQGNAVSIESAGTLEIKAGANKLSFTQSGIELSNAGGKLNIAAAGVELSAQANMTVKANANCDIQANAMFNLKSSAIMNIQGTLVKIN